MTCPTDPNNNNNKENNVMRNGYMVTYFKGITCVDAHTFLDKQDAMDHINVALEMGMSDEMCDYITMHCIDDGDVLYTHELFMVDGRWNDVYINNIMGTTEMNTL